MSQTCPRCGKQIDETVRFCPDCGTPVTEVTPGLAAGPAHGEGAMPPPLQPPPPQTPVQGPYIANNLALAIIAIIFCWPLGIPAIVYATQVDGLARMGQYEAAQKNADLAKKWSIAAIGLVIAGIVIYFLIFVVMFGAMAILPAISNN